MIRSLSFLALALSMLACDGGPRPVPDAARDAAPDASGADGGAADACRDDDGDGYGDGCAAGPDCNDADPAVHPGATQACVGVDTDCDGAIDEGCDCTGDAERTCGSSLGACEAGTQRCADGAWSACEGAVEASDEVCDGALDEDCDGAVDEGCACVNGAERVCGESEGACVQGIETCTAGAWGLCVGAIEPATEVCDGSIDEDCDGNIDEGCACVNGTDRPCGENEGACVQGVETCAAGAWSACEGAVGPAMEVCDGSTDEDCDGLIDEGCSNDPFDPASCTGVAWTGADAAARLAAMGREVLGSATMQRRTRACTGDTCGPWSAPADWNIRYLTYSGGVTTRWTTLPAETNLVLFDDGGSPALSIQHVTFGAGGYPDTHGIVYGFPPSPVTYPHIRAYNTAPAHMYDYRDLDYQVKNGVLVLGDGCARFTAVPFGEGDPDTWQVAVLYRW